MPILCLNFLHMDVLIWILFLLVSLAVLVKASDLFIDFGEVIGRSLGIPAFMIGVTIIAMGTSLPELVSSLVAVVLEENASEIVAGNVVGSNITNICLVLGVVAVIKPGLQIDKSIFKVDFPFLIGSAIIISALMFFDGIFTYVDGIICLLLFFIYMFISIRNARNLRPDQTKKTKISLKTVAGLLFSALLIYIGAKYTVEAIIEISGLLMIGKELVALTIVALGTSLPELVVAIVAVKKGKSEMAIGNLLGSNIFNALAIMGLPSLFSTLMVPASITKFGLPLMIGVTFIYVILALQKRYRLIFGVILILIYIAYLYGLIVLEAINPV